ncbi:uncharacterized protein BXZ73DRAFT_83900 [Epithele typhae]|uniref:uncharacterized protein n=1 Tax=Epithele typhae TaxID=378194 RepID=UPI0020079E74|nr:uncharacterized protein BXZ73DRAFT_83900 [Epithele typhae]KAH9910192.1 hypothetical protein BXZ73DRAFT_83900 [Epithele typhae]
MYLVWDGNFRQHTRPKKVDMEDQSLYRGASYFADSKDLEKHLNLIGEEDKEVRRPVDTCAHTANGRWPSVGVCQHGLVLGGSAVNLSKGERFAMVDFSMMSAWAPYHALLRMKMWDDVGCMFDVNLQKRLCKRRRSPGDLNSENLPKIEVAIGDFHIGAHKTESQTQRDLYDVAVECCKDQKRYYEGLEASLKKHRPELLEQWKGEFKTWEEEVVDMDKRKMEGFQNPFELKEDSSTMEATADRLHSGEEKLETAAPVDDDEMKDSVGVIEDAIKLEDERTCLLEELMQPKVGDTPRKLRGLQQQVQIFAAEASEMEERYKLHVSPSLSHATNKIRTTQAQLPNSFPLDPETEKPLPKDLSNVPNELARTWCRPDASKEDAGRAKEPAIRREETRIKYTEARSKMARLTKEEKDPHLQALKSVEADTQIFTLDHTDRKRGDTHRTPDWIWGDLEWLFQMNDNEIRKILPNALGQYRWQEEIYLRPEEMYRMFATYDFHITRFDKLAEDAKKHQPGDTTNKTSPRLGAATFYYRKKHSWEKLKEAAQEECPEHLYKDTMGLPEKE